MSFSFSPRLPRAAAPVADSFFSAGLKGAFDGLALAGACAAAPAFFLWQGQPLPALCSSLLAGPAGALFLHHRLSGALNAVSDCPRPLLYHPAPATRPVTRAICAAAMFAVLTAPAFPRLVSAPLEQLLPAPKSQPDMQTKKPRKLQMKPH